VLKGSGVLSAHPPASAGSHPSFWSGLVGSPSGRLAGGWCGGAHKIVLTGDRENQRPADLDGAGLSAMPFIHLLGKQDSPMPFSLTPAAVWPIVLLCLSNVFMTFAWYGHLKFKSAPLFIAILASWGIAFFEYCLAVPANRIGHEVYSAAQLKTMQEVITLIVFAGFSVFWLKESLTWNHAIGFMLIAAGAAFVFKG
jgi:uncharacterized protein